MENKENKIIGHIYISEKLTVKVYLCAGELLFDIGYYYSPDKNCYYTYPIRPINNFVNDLEKYFYTIEDLQKHKYYRQDHLFRKKIQHFMRGWNIDKLLGELLYV